MGFLLMIRNLNVPDISMEDILVRASNLLNWAVHRGNSRATHIVGLALQYISPTPVSAAVTSLVGGVVG